MCSATHDTTAALAALQGYPRFTEALPQFEYAAGRYHTAFARTPADLVSIQRLRFEVFNLELQEGLDASFATGLDCDQFDASCHHLIVRSQESGAAVGTYRVQTQAMANAGAGWYTASEFDLSALPAWLLESGVETGRACVAREHRNGRVLNHLWRGLAAYLAWNHKRYLFGCCSLTSQDAHVAKQTYDFLASGGFLRRDLAAPALPEYRCYGPDFVADVDVSVKLPPLFAGYLKLGAKIVGEPALDRHFKTIDFLALLDVQALDAHTHRSFFPH